MRNGAMAIGIPALVLLGLAGAASGANYTIQWLDMSSAATFGNPVAPVTNYNVPGIGNVTMSYNFPSSPAFTHARAFTPDLQNGTLVSGPDTYSWGAHEQYAAIFTDQPDPITPVPWSITYTFPNTLPAGTVFVGVSGLGSTTSFGGGDSTVQVGWNGTFLGDWFTGGGPWGPTQYTGGLFTFSMKNSLTGPGGQDPWWNTPLGVVRIDDSVVSVTLNFATLRGDGVGGNIGFVVPAPGAAALLGLGGLRAARRRR